MPKPDVQKLLSEANKLSASGFDWRAIAVEYGPVVLQVLMSLVEGIRSNQGGSQPLPAPGKPAPTAAPADPQLREKTADLVSAILDHPDHDQAKT